MSLKLREVIWHTEWARTVRVVDRNVTVIYILQ